VPGAPPTQMLSGRWSGQDNMNFVVVFNGNPAHNDILKFLPIFHSYFREDCLLALVVGYSCILINGIPICCELGQPLASGDQLFNELKCNSSLKGITFLRAPRWYRENWITPGHKHASVTVAIIDLDGKMVKQLE
jgi:hypothetical protein